MVVIVMDQLQSTSGAVLGLPRTSIAMAMGMVVMMVVMMMA